jgi:hypothetical protein
MRIDLVPDVDCPGFTVGLSAIGWAQNRALLRDRGAAVERAVGDRDRVSTI